MKKIKYSFHHFIIVDGQKKEINPNKVDFISDRCKLFGANLSTGKEHEIVKMGTQ